MIGTNLDLNVLNDTQGGQAASIEFNHIIANIKAMKQISVAVVDGAELELRYFLERAKEQKTAAIIEAFLKHGGQTEREAKDIQGIFVDTAQELAK